MKKYFQHIVTLIIFLFSYLMLFIFWNILTDALLVPWDTTFIDDRPALGTSSRIINDFFEGGIGSYIPLATLFIASMTIFVVRIIKKQHKLLFVAMHTAVTNFFYIGIMISGVVLYNIVFPIVEKISYNPISILLHIGLLIVLFFVQYTSYIPYTRKS